MTQLITTHHDTLPAMPAAEPPENPHSVARRLTEAAFRSKGLVILLAMLGGTIGAALGILKPNEYVSTATFLFRDGSEQVPIKLTGELPRGWGESAGVSANAPHLLVAPALARRTVERIGVAKVAQPFKPKQENNSWVTQQIRQLQGSIHDRDPSRVSVDDGMRLFLGSLKISEFRRAALLNVSYTANDPRLAQEILEAYVDEATKFHIEMYDEEKTIKLVEATYETSKSEYEKYKKAHQEMLQTTGLVNFELEFSALQLESSEAVRALRTLVEQTIPSLEIHIREAGKNLETMAPRIEKTVHVPVPNELIGRYNDQILRARAELMAAKNKFLRDDAPVVMRLQRTLKTLEESLRTERERPPQVVSRKESVVNEEYTMLKAQLHASKIDLVVAKRNVEPFEKRAKTQKARLDEVAKVAPTYRALASDLERTRLNLLSASMQLSQAHTKQRLAAFQLSTLKLVGKPTFQPSRTGPRRGQMALLGLLGGLGIALGLLGVRALTDSTIRTPEELEQMLGLRVLATVPDLRGKHVRRHENRIMSGC